MNVKDLQIQIEESLDGMSSVDLANEVVDWALANVENFIDNHQRKFVLSLSFSGDDDVKDAIPTGKRLAALFDLFDESLLKILSAEYGHDVEKELDMSIEEIIAESERQAPDFDADNHHEEKPKPVLADEEDENIVTDLAERLFQFVGDAYDHLGSADMKARIEELFKKMKYYYELTGFRNGEPVFRELKGYLKIERFDFDAIETPVEVTQKIPIVENGEVVGMEDMGKVTYMLPPGFTLELNIVLWEDSVQTSLF